MAYRQRMRHQLQVKLSEEQWEIIRAAAHHQIGRQLNGNLADVYREWLLAAARREMASGPGTGVDDSGKPYELDGAGE